MSQRHQIFLIQKINKNTKWRENIDKVDRKYKEIIYKKKEKGIKKNRD